MQTTTLGARGAEASRAEKLDTVGPHPLHHKATTWGTPSYPDLTGIHVLLVDDDAALENSGSYLATPRP